MDYLERGLTFLAYYGTGAATVEAVYNYFSDSEGGSGSDTGSGDDGGNDSDAGGSGSDDNKGVARTGTTKKVITEISLDKLNPLHSVPRPGKPANHVENLAQSIKTGGYDVNQAIPVLKLPNGKLVSAGGHHRVAAMKSLGEKTIPSRVVEWNSLSKAAQQRHLDAHYGKTLQEYLK